MTCKRAEAFQSAAYQYVLRRFADPRCVLFWHDYISSSKSFRYPTIGCPTPSESFIYHFLRCQRQEHAASIHFGFVQRMLNQLFLQPNDPTLSDQSLLWVMARPFETDRSFYFVPFSKEFTCALRNFVLKSLTSIVGLKRTFFYMSDYFFVLRASRSFLCCSKRYLP